MLLRVVVIAVLLAVSGCVGRTPGWRLMDEAAALMEERPDSALAVLGEMAADSLRGEEERARYALLLSMALDKNYVDTATFDVLQPAIAYYLDKGEGSGDDRLRTLYYQGRIYQNRGDDSRAMVSFFRASEADGITDTLTLARTLVALSVISYYSYDARGMMNYALSAADMYEKLSLPDLQMSCYIKAMGGSVLLLDQNRSDSIFRLCETLVEKCPEYSDNVKMERLSYLINYSKKTDLEKTLDSIASMGVISNELKIEIAQGFLKLGKPQISLHYISTLDSIQEDISSPHELIIKSDVYEANGMYKEALESFKEYSSITGEEEVTGAGYDLSFAKDQYAKDVKVLEDRQRNDRLILGILICTLILIVAVGVLYYRNKLVKARMLMVEKDNERLRVSQALMSKSNEILMFEKRNVELERDNQTLLREKIQNESVRLEKEKQFIENERDLQVVIAENRRFRIEQMKNEISSLRVLLDRKESMAAHVEGAVVERISMLNSLMAYEISDNGRHAEAYKEWKESMLHDCEMFMNTTRLAYKACYPNFITYLEEHGLTESEINYTCLYALGLNGKEVGNYIHLQRHYHISSAIRKKLGIETNGMNFGNYVRRLMNER